MRRILPFRLFVSAALFGLTLTACDLRYEAETFPQPNKIPQRIVSLTPNLTEILFDLGLGDRVVAVSDYCRHPEAMNALPRVGGLTDPNIEKIVALKPDLILSYQSNTRITEFAKKHNVALLSLAVETIRDVTEAMLTIGESAGVMPQAQARVQDFSRRLHRTEYALGELPQKRVLFVVGRDAGSLKNLYVAGPNTYIDEMIKLARGVNVVTDTAALYPTLDKEKVLMSNPDVIIEGFHGKDFGGDALRRQREEWASLDSLPAVRDGHIRFHLGERMTIPGPGIPESLADLAGLIHHLDPAPLKERGVVQRMQR